MRMRRQILQIRFTIGRVMVLERIAIGFAEAAQSNPDTYDIYREI
jgi:hypothetical protein